MIYFKYITPMVKRLIYITAIILHSVINVKAQYSTEIEYDKTMCELINTYRKSMGKSKLTWSDNLYTKVSKPQGQLTKEEFIKTNNLKHIQPLLKKYNVAEILAYNSADSNKCFGKLVNPFRITCLKCNPFKKVIKEDFTNFVKKHFKSLYKKTLVNGKVLKKIDKTHYTGIGFKTGRYSYNRNAFVVDSVVNGVSYITSYERVVLNKKISVNDYSNLPNDVKEKLRMCMSIMQWHYSPGHKKIMLGKYKEFAASNVIVDDKLISVVNFT